MDGITVRTILDVDLFDVGPVTFPAYSGATSNVARDEAGVDSTEERMKRGQNFAAALDAAIVANVTDDMTHEQVIDKLSGASGMEPASVVAFLDDANETCPTMQILESFSQALGVSLDQLKAAAQADGCQYNSDEEAHKPDEDEIRMRISSLDD